MSTPELILLVTASTAVGALIAALLVRSHWAVKAGILQANYNSLQKQYEDQSRFLASSEKTMRDTFGALAADALRQNNQTFVSLAESRLNEKVTEARGVLDTKEKAIDGLIRPLTASLEKMDSKINLLETKREGAYSSLRTVLEEMKLSALALDKGTQNLLSALKTSSTRGRYGEIGLRRLVEFAGMTEHCDFVEQLSTASEEGVLRPDMIIHLPEKKTIVVDAKTPLDAYMKIFETENEAEQQIFLSQHARAVKNHLKQLSTKAYWTQFPESPDYVVLYMQIESSFGAALQADPDLIEEGIRNKVIFATPTTLITLLRTVGFVWQQRNIADHIEEIRDTGIELYNRTTTLLKHFSNMGSSLKMAVSHYNSAVSSLESRFIPQAKKLHALGSAYTKNTLPDLEQIESAVREVSPPEDPEGPSSPTK